MSCISKPFTHIRSSFSEHVMCDLRGTRSPGSQSEWHRDMVAVRVSCCSSDVACLDSTKQQVRSMQDSSLRWNGRVAMCGFPVGGPQDTGGRDREAESGRRQHWLREVLVGIAAMDAMGCGPGDPWRAEWNAHQNYPQRSSRDPCPQGLGSTEGGRFATGWLHTSPGRVGFPKGRNQQAASMPSSSQPLGTLSVSQQGSEGMKTLWVRDQTKPNTTPNLGGLQSHHTANCFPYIILEATLTCQLCPAHFSSCPTAPPSLRCPWPCRRKTSPQAAAQHANLSRAGSGAPPNHSAKTPHLLPPVMGGPTLGHWRVFFWAQGAIWAQYFGTAVLVAVIDTDALSVHFLWL